MSTLEDYADAVGVGRIISYGKLKRLVGYGAVGASGIVVDLGIVEGLTLVGVHHLAAVAVAYLAAMSYNFVLQRRYVYQATAGNAVRQWIRYFLVDFTAFLIRVGVVVATVDVIGLWDALPYIPAPIHPAVPASFVGIVLAFVVGFQGTDTVVFGEYTEGRHDTHRD